MASERKRLQEENWEKDILKIQANCSVIYEELNVSEGRKAYSQMTFIRVNCIVPEKLCTAQNVAAN